ncbi:MAG: hypothetical protein EXR07_21465 [Acetobacteraceae bacterium]|nr:hypothetical protein [Acetobacteraceae bacterium]
MAATKATKAKPASGRAPARGQPRKMRAKEKAEGTMEELDAFLDKLNARADVILADIRRITRGIGGG